MNKKIVYSLLFIIFSFNFTFAQEKKAKNIILLIGDGMGLAHLYAAMSSSPSPLNIERCTTTGISKTYSASNFTTDSGAGGTAIACGVKTKNGMIGMSPDSVAKESLLKIAERNGLATGIVVSCNITHATPASFVANQVNRNMYDEIAADYLKTEIEVFIGGGLDNFNKRKDNRNLIDSLISKGYQIRYSINETQAVHEGKLACFVAKDHPPKAAERDDLLAKGTLKAIEILAQDSDGFFLMIEGSQIDWEAHKNNFNGVVSEVLDFDKAIAVALDFAEKNGETLVIITSDHETGGLTLLDKEKGEIKSHFKTLHHSATPVGIYSYGPYAHLYTGIMENTSIFTITSKILQRK